MIRPPPISPLFPYPPLSRSFFAFSRQNIEPQRIPADWRRFDLQDREQPGLHELAELLVHQLRAVSLAAEFAEPLCHVTGPEFLESFHRHAVEMIKAARRDRDKDRHLAIGRGFRVS